MTQGPQSRVVLCQALPDSTHNEVHLGSLLQKAVAGFASKMGPPSVQPWALKIPLTASGTVNPVSPLWVGRAQQGLQEAGRTTGPVFDNLSITTVGLETEAGLLARAEQIGLADFVVGDQVTGGPASLVKLSGALGLTEASLASVAAGAGGLLLLSDTRPHPHLGMTGALFNLGSGIFDRETKLRLHQEVRPSVDVPLCAGCGSCLAVCIFDAITIRGGRAFIDHQLCTGCGECMSACHLAGISVEDATGIVRFQKLLAETASAAASGGQFSQGSELLFANFVGQRSTAVSGRMRENRGLADSQDVLVSSDPVALDQATWDFLVQDAPWGLRQWSGFFQEPGVLLEQAEILGLGHRSYEREILT